VDALKANDRLAKHLLKEFGDKASHAINDINNAIFDHNEKHGLRNAA
jgi:hypothetical protein